MKIISIVLSLIITLFLAVAVQADDPAYLQGLDSLKSGDLNQALVSFKTAVTNNPQNKEYTQEFLILRQVAAMQSQLDQETNPVRWNAYAQRLRTYFEQKGSDSLSLDLNRKIYARYPSGDNAGLLGESLTVNGKAGEAIELLDKLPSPTPLSQSSLALAYLHNDNKDAARKIVDSFSTANITNPVRLRLARLEAGLGEKDKAVASMKTLFEQTPPSQQATLREYCKQFPEFASLQSDAMFTAAMQTPSKITESACSGGSSCGTCPMRAKCQGAQ